MGAWRDQLGRWRLWRRPARPAEIPDGTRRDRRRPAAGGTTATPGGSLQVIRDGTLERNTRQQTYGQSTGPGAPGVSPAAPRPRSAPDDMTLPGWGAPVLGIPAVAAEPRPPESLSYRPDAVADGWAAGGFVVRAASVRGRLHRRRGTPRQDDLAVSFHPRTRSVAFAVADGVPAARHSHIGASAACRAAVGALLTDLDRAGTGAEPMIDWPGLVEQAAWQVIAQARTLLGPGTSAETAEEQFATTLAAGLVRPVPGGARISMIRIGDSQAWILAGRRFRRLPDDDGGAPDAATPPPGPSHPAAAPAALPRVPPVTARGGSLQPGEVLLVGTDGFGAPLGGGEDEVGEHFAAALAHPPAPARFLLDLDFSRLSCEDDRTLIAIWLR